MIPPLTAGPSCCLSCAQVWNSSNSNHSSTYVSKDGRVYLICIEQLANDPLEVLCRAVDNCVTNNHICFVYRSYNPVLLFSFTTYNRIPNKSNTTSVTCGAGIANPSGALEITSSSQWDSYYSIFGFMCSALWIIVWLSLLLSVIVLSVFGITVFDCPHCHIQAFL